MGQRIEGKARLVAASELGLLASFKSVDELIRVIRELLSLPCPCVREDNLVWRDERGRAVPLPLSRRAASARETPAPRLHLTRCGGQ